jgi:hypothetical protein
VRALRSSLIDRASGHAGVAGQPKWLGGAGLHMLVAALVAEPDPRGTGGGAVRLDSAVA